MYCQCGCGEKTPLATKTRKRHGHVKGQPKAFIHGHNRRKSGIDYIIEDHGYTTPCWIWQRSRTPQGYGRAYRAGRKITAHKALWEDRHGLIPAGQELHHLCENKTCVNPNHLEPTTPSQHPKILDHDKAERIRERYAAGETQVALAQEFGCTPSNIYCAVHRKSWA